MLGVMRLIFDDDCESMSGDDDFFSVARTMPLVAANSSQHCWKPMSGVTYSCVRCCLLQYGGTRKISRAHTNLYQLSAI